MEAKKTFQVHHTGRFLPWHRWYVNAYEQALTAKCGYRGVSPYWDWTLGRPRKNPDIEMKSVC